MNKNPRPTLGHCPECKEPSVVVRKYGPGNLKRIEICVNKGCGYSKDLPDLVKKEKKI
jgi:hypothetical protein